MARGKAGFVPVLCLVLLCLLALPEPSSAREKVVGVLLSREIAPYVVMVEGLEARLGNRPVDRFFLDEQGRAYSLGGRAALLQPSQYDILVAVGPEALRHLHGRTGNVPLLYGMVLNPQNVVQSSNSSVCGVSLNLPVQGQFSAILRHIESLKRLGILFDPENNRQWFEEALPIAASMGIELIPFRVNQEGGRLSMDGDFPRAQALLFIPDRSIISRAVIQHVIKQAVLHKIPVIGYNRFFHESGAAISFLIDYRRLGEQVAAEVERVLAGGRCEERIAPVFETMVNDQVWKVLEPGRGEGAP